MTTLILWVGLGLAAISALAMRRPDWRVPALVFAILALPGNIDNLLPQMLLMQFSAERQQISPGAL